MARSRSGRAGIKGTEESPVRLEPGQARIAQEQACVEPCSLVEIMLGAGLVQRARRRAVRSGLVRAAKGDGDGPGRDGAGEQPLEP